MDDSGGTALSVSTPASNGNHAVASLSDAASSPLARQIIDGLHGLTEFTASVFSTLPNLPDEEVLVVRHYAREIGRRGWQLECACDAEIERRVDARRGPGVRDVGGIGKWATLQAIAAEDGMPSTATLYRNAQIFRTFIADENFLNVEKVLTDKSYFVLALDAPDPRAAVDHFVARKLEDSHYSTGDARRDVYVMRRAEQHKRFAAVPFPAGSFSIVYADPPWRYEFTEAENRAIENQYPTMTLQEICDLDVGSLCDDDAILFLWATSPKLEEAMRVIAAWGFDYRTNLVWVKDQIGMGYYARQQHELLLVARRGDFPAPEPTNRPPSVIRSPRTVHSRKPESMYDLIDRMYPGRKKVELFCRGTARPDWSAWGNEVRAEGGA